MCLLDGKPTSPIENAFSVSKKLDELELELASLTTDMTANRGQSRRPVEPAIERIQRDLTRLAHYLLSSGLHGPGTNAEEGLRCVALMAISRCIWQSRRPPQRPHQPSDSGKVDLAQLVAAVARDESVGAKERLVVGRWLLN